MFIISVKFGKKWIHGHVEYDTYGEAETKLNELKELGQGRNKLRIDSYDSIYR